MAMHSFRTALNETRKIAYQSNGHRAISPETFLPTALKAAKQIGLTRIGRLSELVDVGYPVFQAARPNIWSHQYAGITSGSNGKGATEIQALLSCILEGLENYCMEPRDPHLIRASFRDLSSAYPTINPSYLVRASNAQQVDADEPLLWKEAYCPALDEMAFVPAEMVYFPLSVASHGTRPIFPKGGYSGHAAGTTYLDAAVHALFELIERKFKEKRDFGRHKAIFVPPESFPALEKLVNTGLWSYVWLWLIECEEFSPMPVFCCQLYGSAGFLEGWGCNFDFDVAADRAISEAVQCYAAGVSGSREDIGVGPTPMTEPLVKNRILDVNKPPKPISPENMLQLDYEAAKARAGHRRFSTLQEIYLALQQWLTQSGYPLVFLVNNSATGIDIPVVRAIVAQMQPAVKYPVWEIPLDPTHQDILSFKYRWL
jgi:ribosomal protein S12 methylthiotransferase accessory factor